jgi:hypothetical protein
MCGATLRRCKAAPSLLRRQALVERREAPRVDHRLRRAHADEARKRHRVAIAHQRHGLPGGDDPVLHCAVAAERRGVDYIDSLSIAR